jgi:hypothetical protein
LINRPSPSQVAYIEATGAHALVAIRAGRFVSHMVTASPWKRVSKGRLVAIHWHASQRHAEEAKSAIMAGNAAPRHYDHQTFMRMADDTYEAAKRAYRRVETVAGRKAAKAAWRRQNEQRFVDGRSKVCWADYQEQVIHRVMARMLR